MTLIQALSLKVRGAKINGKKEKKIEVSELLLRVMNSRENSLTGSRTPISRALPNDKRKS
jgi:hypothetical protein